jgi:C1A family cysteine protease
MGNVSASVRSASKTLQPLVSQKQSLLKIPSLLQHRSGAMTYQFRMFSTVFEDIDPENLKAEVDFRRSGTMTSIDHQGGCGSCWAYAMVSAVESVKQLKTGILEKLSSQELIDCLEGFQGCEKGWPDIALDYIQRRGVSLYEDYPLHPLR